MPELPHEKAVSSSLIYSGRVVKLRRDEVVFPDGKEAVREIVEHNGAVAIAAIDDMRNIYLVRQYRYAHDREFLELPAGKLDYADEVPIEAAARELREETGFTADSIEYLGHIVPSVAICTEKIYIFLARRLHSGSQELDDDEFLNVIKMPLDELYRMAAEGRIQDGKTLCALTLLWGKKDLEGFDV